MSGHKEPWKPELWKAVDPFYAVPRKVLDERDFIRSTLAFANEGTVRALAAQVSGIPIPAGFTNDPDWLKAADRVALKHWASERLELINNLERVIARDADPRFVAHLNEHARVLPIPQFKGDAVGYHYLVRDLFAANAFAIKLFLDPAKPYGNDVHRCQWEECQRFFLSSDLRKRKELENPKGLKGGKPRTEFCSDPCMRIKRDRRRFETPTRAS